MVSLVLIATHAWAAENHLTYETYAAGLNVLNIDATLDINPTDYRIQFTSRTAGAFSLVVSGQMQTTVTGKRTPSGVAPIRSYSQGQFRGSERRTLIDYVAGQPQVRVLEPAVDPDRDPVPEAMQRDTVDPESAIAALIYRINTSSKCEGSARVFDGRRLSEIRATTAGMELLTGDSKVQYSGPALRCDFEGRQLGGFLHDVSEAELKRIQRGSAWFAPLGAGGFSLPVRMQFSTRLFGAATMYLVKHD